MCGDGKRGVGHRPQATAPILDSTNSDIDRRWNKSTLEAAGLVGSTSDWRDPRCARAQVADLRRCVHFHGQRRIRQPGSIHRLLKKLCRMLSLFGYQFQSSSSVSCSIRQTSSSTAELETASWKPLRTMASDHSEHVQKVCKPANSL